MRCCIMSNYSQAPEVPPTSAVRTGALAVTEKAMLEDVEKDGETLLLADGRRLFVVNDEDATVASIWLPPVRLTLRKGKRGSLSVTNEDNGETISATAAAGA
jgi:hypothetical protein